MIREPLEKVLEVTLAALPTIAPSVYGLPRMTIGERGTEGEVVYRDSTPSTAMSTPLKKSAVLNRRVKTFPA